MLGNINKEKTYELVRKGTIKAIKVGRPHQEQIITDYYNEDLVNGNKNI